jgi:hypothetical protein
MKITDDFRERLIDEWADLQKKRCRLTRAISHFEYEGRNEINQQDLQLLKEQAAVMKEYAAILMKRIG